MKIEINHGEDNYPSDKINLTQLGQELKAINPDISVSANPGEKIWVEIHSGDATGLAEAIAAHAPEMSSEEVAALVNQETQEYLSVEKIKELEARIAALEAK